MSKFVFIYHGGTGMPESQEAAQAEMAKWSAWYQSMGDKVVDGGAPVGKSWTVDASGSREGAKDPASGYTIVSADSIEDAIEMAKQSPVIGNGGSVEVATYIDLDM